MHSVATIGSQLLLLATLVLLFASQQVSAAYYYYSSYRYSYSSRIYVGYYYGSYYYTGAVVSVGAIIGGVIGALTFIGLVVGLIVFLCCLRQRRRASAAARARQVPMTVGGPTVVSTVTPGGYPAAPVGGLPYEYPKQDSGAPPPYPYAGGTPGYYDNTGYQNGQAVPPYPTAADAQMQPPLPAAGAEQQRF